MESYHGIRNPITAGESPGTRGRNSKNNLLEIELVAESLGFVDISNKANEGT